MSQVLGVGQDQLNNHSLLIRCHTFHLRASAFITFFFFPPSLIHSSNTWYKTPMCQALCEDYMIEKRSPSLHGLLLDDESRKKLTHTE